MSRTIKLLRVWMMKEKKLRKKAVLRMRVVQKKVTKYQLNGPIFPPKSNVQALIYLQNLLSEINLFALEKDLQGCFFAEIYYSDFSEKEKNKVFIGKLLCCYLTDKGSATLSIDLICLELVIGCPTVLFECPAHLGEDAVRLRCLILFLGILKQILLEVINGIFQHIQKTFSVDAKLEHKELYCQFYNIVLGTAFIFSYKKQLCSYYKIAHLRKHISHSPSPVTINYPYSTIVEVIVITFEIMYTAGF